MIVQNVQSSNAAASVLPFLDRKTVDVLLGTNSQQKQQIILMLQSTLHEPEQPIDTSLSDEEMDALLAMRPSFDESKYVEPSEADWEVIKRQRNGRLTKGLDKWL